MSLTSVLNLQRMPSASRVEPIALKCQCPAAVKLWLRRSLSTGLGCALYITRLLETPAGGDNLDKRQVCALDAENGDVAGTRVHCEQQRVVLTKGQ